MRADHPLEATRERLDRVRQDLERPPGGLDQMGERVSEVHKASAGNLIDYVALRRRDLRDLQDDLAALGLSSLGRSESHVRATVRAVERDLNLLGDRSFSVQETAGIGFDEGGAALTRHAAALLGPPPPGREVRIMVTLPSDAADDEGLALRLIEAGMDCARINCAHDDPLRWERMIRSIREAEHAISRPCRILMDLSGPKLRTGPIAHGPSTLRLRPRRDELGQVVKPARLRLVPDAAMASGRSRTPTVPVPAEWLTRLDAGNRIRLIDARGAARTLVVAAVDDGGCDVEAEETTYLLSGIQLDARRPGCGVARLGALPPRARSLKLAEGNQLILTRDLTPADPHSQPPRIGCTLAQVLCDLRPGHRVLFDDGTIEAVVESAEAEEANLRVTRVPPGGGKLKAERGINVPDTELGFGALTAQDRIDLGFVATHADLVGLSFVRQSSDVEELQAALTELGADEMGIVLKIETMAAFANLPKLLLTAMRSRAAGAMIARGDLAVECGWERLAELQEEILWACEAGHLPVIWATQVLANLAKTGVPSRAEITDAAMGIRAECVMLNKGPHVEHAVRSLDDILRRMAAHQRKKTSLLRELHSWYEEGPS